MRNFAISRKGSICFRSVIEMSAQTESAVENLSAGEAKLYDRQLRLWGVEAQQKLRSTDVLMAGMGCLGAEICKNIVLTGVRSVTLLDHRTLTSSDIPGQFMAPCDALGQNRASASVARVSALNPNVKISAFERNLKDMEPEFFDQFKIVCVIGYPFEVLQQVDTICESKNVSFLAADCFGAFGYFFSNLGKDFNCHSETIIEEKDGTQTKKVDPHVVNFKKFSECFHKRYVSEAGDVKSKQSKAALDDVFVLAHLRNKVLSADSEGTNREVNFEQLVDWMDEAADHLGVSPQMKSSLPFFLICDANVTSSNGLSEVSAVVGGVIGQEIIKIASRNDVPFNNFYSYNAVQSISRVVTL